MPAPTPSAWEARVRDLRAAIDTSSGKAYEQALNDFMALDPIERQFLALDVQLTTAEATAATSRELRRLRGMLKVIGDELANAELPRATRAVVRGLGTTIELLEELAGEDLPPDEDDDFDGAGLRDPVEGPEGEVFVDEDGNPLDVEPVEPEEVAARTRAPAPSPAPAPAPAPSPAPAAAPSPAPKKPAPRRSRSKKPATPKKPAADPKGADAAPAPAPRRRNRSRKGAAASKTAAETVALATGHPSPE